MYITTARTEIVHQEIESESESKPRARDGSPSTCDPERIWHWKMPPELNTARQEGALCTRKPRSVATSFHPRPSRPFCASFLFASSLSPQQHLQRRYAGMGRRCNIQIPAALDRLVTVLLPQSIEVLLPKATVPCSTTLSIPKFMLVLVVVPCTSAKPTSRVPGSNQTTAGKDALGTAQSPTEMASSHQGIATAPRHSRTSTGDEHTQTPVTPDQRCRRRLLHANSLDSCTHGRVALSPIGSASFRPTTTDIFTDYRRVEATTTPYKLPRPNTGPASSSQLANIRVRRAHHGPALLQSPARAGHAARMRQIFEDAGRGNQTQHPNRDTLYPQLPNISRKASSPPEHNATGEGQPPHHSPIHRPESLCMSTKSFRPVPYQLHAECTAVSEASSESWSDDSGYFIAGSRTRSSNAAVPPRERISNWLLNVSPSEPDHATEVAESEIDSLKSSPEPLPWEYHDDTLQSYTSHPNGATSQLDPFVEDNHKLKRHSLFNSKRVLLDNPNATHSIVTIRSLSHNPISPKPTILDDGGVELSPLSPNVCIERGPTRYHSAHRNSPLPSPIQERHPAQARRHGFQENLATELTLDSPRGRKNTLAPCKIGVGTRFQHARHDMGDGNGAGGLTRFGRPVQD
ncbi:hypothetical protein PTNB85_09616 [Pyrenophora teres f. teres]|nr:hypothetical protein PTNB85_09616 [Pyrenophora teres f. teres]KAE8831708.1 hypothetical protein HRS9139_05950 [Pyrenophora teres f. teres]KAE8835554.1 hypothetical protein HRS9122_07824 [Pyrenophora teres f. teres]KAE8858454.1 hypothetical protein PTNB29_07669 [Pyrenophora teres f. teres]